MKTLLFILAMWSPRGRAEDEKTVAGDEQLLIERIKQGDEQAFMVLVDRYKHKAYRIAYRFTDNAEDAEDLSQEAFLKLYRAIGSFKGESGFYTWFYRILVNVCIDYTRKHKKTAGADSRSRERYGNGELTPEDCEDHRADADPAAAVFNIELSAKVAEEIAALPDRQQQVFILRHYEGFRLREIAEMINCAEGTVKAHLFRAVCTLKERLSPYVFGNEGR